MTKAGDGLVRLRAWWFRRQGLSSEKALRARVADSAADTHRFIRRQLGDAKLSSVDPPGQRATRIAFCDK